MARTLPGDEGEGSRPTERKRALTPTRARQSAPLPGEGAQIGSLFERSQAAFRMRMRRKQMQQLRHTLFDIRMRELQAIDRDQERERLLPVPGPDRMPISPAERDQAQERMTAEVEREDYLQTPRPQDRTSLADFRDRREPVERQTERSAEIAARSLTDWRAQRQQVEPRRDPQDEREPERER